MTRTKTIAVGFDGSDLSRAALDWATAEAERRGWGVHVVSSYFLPSQAAVGFDVGTIEIDEETLRREAEGLVEEAADRARERGITVTTKIDTIDPVRLLVEVSREVSMIVVGTRGGGGFADRLLGTVSSSVPAHAHCPTVVVPSHEGAEKFLPIRRIVAGTDGSESSTIAMRTAVDEARTWDAELTAVAAVPIPTGFGMGWIPDTVDRSEVLADVKSALDATVEEAIGGTDVRYKTHALDGNAAALMAEFSTAVELIVVGTRGRGGFRGLLLGSTSQAILQYATCPVMVVPSRVAGEAEGFDPTDVPWGRR